MKHFMKQKGIKKMTGILLSLAMAGSMLSGCSGSGNNSDEAEKNTSETVSQDNNSKNDDSQEIETLSIGLAQNSNVENYDTNYLTQLIEKECNVKLEFVYLPSSVDDAKSKFAIMASSNTTLPDVVAVDTNQFTDLEIADYGSKGIFIPLNEYLENPDLAQNFMQIPDADREKMISASTSPDGNIYCLTQNTPEDWNMTPFRFWINKTWLDNLNLKAPATTDEFHDVLNAFVKQDPNGNGTADEIGMTGCTDGWGCNPAFYLMNSFIFYNGNQSNGGLSLDEAGTHVIAPFAEDKWLDGLTYMNMLCSEGLLSPAIFTQDATQFTSVLSNDPQIIGSCAAGGFGYWSGAQENANFQDMELLPPLTGPDGIAYAAYNEYTPTPCYMITKDCKNPELAFKIGDYFYKNNISLTVRYGEEGVDWTKDAETCKQYKGLYEDLWNIPCSFVQLNTVWSSVQNKHWYNIGPRYTSLESYRGINSDQPAGSDKTDYTALSRQQSAEYYMDAHPGKVLPTLKYTNDEAEELAEIQANINTYVKQSLAEFVTGNRPLSDWDSYIKELNTMGLSKWLEIAQTAYDRMQKQ